jgi:hypothetical protein
MVAGVAEQAGLAAHRVLAQKAPQARMIVARPGMIQLRGIGLHAGQGIGVAIAGGRRPAYAEISEGPKV